MHRRLDPSDDPTRNAELPDPAVRFADFHPPNRLRLVRPVEQLVPDGWPVLAQVSPRGLDGHSIDARSPFVCPDTFPRYLQVFSVTYFLQ